MSDQPVSLTPTGPPETILGPEPTEALDATAAAMALADPLEARKAIAAVLAKYPQFLEGWARYGDLAVEPMDAYAAYRVGYHRGLDRLRQSGWRGSGYVRWQHETNRGFLRALAGLQRAAGVIDEREEHDRCAHFLAQLDPNWPPSELG